MQPTIDPSIIPWSHRGSYLCLATRSGQNGRLTPAKDVYLISHRHPAGLPLFAIRPLAPGTIKPDHPPSGFSTSPSSARFSAVPSTLSWHMIGKDGSDADSHAVVEATWQDVKTLRLRGTVPASFDTQGSLNVDQWRCWLWRVPPTADGKRIIEFNTTPNTNLRIEIKSGEVELENDAPYDFNFKDNNRRMTVRPGEGGGTWELIVTERDSEAGDEKIVGGNAADSFEDCVKRTEATFDDYVRGMCGWKTGNVTDADRLAAYVMWTSTVRPAGFLQSEAVLMSKLWMNKLWSWDNCINGLALVNYDITTALEQIMLPFTHITPGGRLPDSMTSTEILYDYTKPPIYGWTFYKLLELLDPSSTADKPRFDLLPQGKLREIYTSVAKFTRYWYEHRATSTSALPYYAHGNDSGWDNSTAYDNQTVCISPDLAGFLVLQCDLLAKLANHLSQPNYDVNAWTRLRDQTAEALVSELWDDKAQAFAFKDAFTGRTWTTTTLLQFIPLVAAPYLPKGIVDTSIAKLDAYLTEWGLATERPDSEHYESDGYWRGPIWAPPTLILESAVRAAGHTDVADTIASRYVRLCEKNGFAENYDAKTGKGNRDLSYTWAASAYLALRHEIERRGT